MLKRILFPLTTLKILILFTIIGFCIYGNSLFNEFMRDDNSLILKNPLIRDLQNIPQLLFGSTFYGGDANTLIGRYYKPVQSIYFTIIIAIFGLHNYVFHFFQILLHIINAVLLYKLFEKFFKKSLAVFLGLLFLVHPINTESVIYVANTQEVLFLFFGLLALLLSTKKNLTTINLIMIGITLLLSMLSKETGILFIPLTFIYIYFYNRKHFIKLLTLSAGLIILYIFLRIQSIGFSGLHNESVPSAPIMKADFLQRIINIPLIIYTYVTTFLFPKDLVISQSWVIKTLNAKDFFIPLLFDLGLIGLIILEGIIMFRKFSAKFKDYIFFLAIFLLGLGLHLHLVPLLDMTITDRWFYLPIIGLLGLIGIIINNSKIENTKIRIFFLIIGVTVIVLLCTRVIYRNLDWKDEFTLASHDIKISRESYHLEQTLANNYFLRNDIDQAIYHYKKSIQIYPYFTNYTNLGTVYKKTQQLEKAEESYKKALTIADYYLTYEQLSILYFSNKKDYISAKETATKGLRLYPSNQKLLLILTLAYYKLNDMENAKKIAAICYNRTKNKDCYTVYVGIVKNLPIKGI